MYKVRVSNACRCFLKSGFPEVAEYETKEEAKREAQEILNKMNSTFCHKHEFSLSEQFGDCTIFIRAR